MHVTVVEVISACRLMWR